MTISNLQIGDEVTYLVPSEFFLDATMLDGKVTGTFRNHVEINNSFLIHISKIVSKKTKDVVKKEPRTFKFEIIVTRGNSVSTVIKNDMYVRVVKSRRINTVDGYTIEDGAQIDFSGLLAPDWMELGKSYTIEIKEK